jgi:hypothetical protein
MTCSQTFFLCFAWHKMNILNLSLSRTIALQILNKSTSKPQGAQLLILANIPVKFHNPRSNTFWATWNCGTDGQTDKGESKWPPHYRGHLGNIKYVKFILKGQKEIPNHEDSFGLETKTWSIFLTNALFKGN